MRTIAKVMEVFGTVCVFLGLGCMDSELVIIPIAILFTGGAIALAGVSVEGSEA